MEKFTGHWYEIQRDNNLKAWPCVTQEAEYISDDSSWPLRLNNYINGNKVIQSEKATID